MPGGQHRISVLGALRLAFLGSHDPDVRIELEHRGPQRRRKQEEAQHCEERFRTPSETAEGLQQGRRYSQGPGGVADEPWRIEGWNRQSRRRRAFRFDRPQF